MPLQEHRFAALSKRFLTLAHSHQRVVGRILLGAGFLVALLAWSVGLVPRAGTFLLTSGVLVFAAAAFMWSTRNELISTHHMIKKLDEGEMSAPQILRLALLPVILLYLLTFLGAFSLSFVLLVKLT